MKKMENRDYNYISFINKISDIFKNLLDFKQKIKKSKQIIYRITDFQIFLSDFTSDIGLSSEINDRSNTLSYFKQKFKKKN